MTRVSLSPRSPGPVLTAALRAAEQGWPVFPAGAGKQPWIRAAHPVGHPCAGECGTDGHGWRDATCDPDRIRSWWNRWPGIPAYGIATGPAGLVVVDLDTGKGTAPAAVLPDQKPDEPTPVWVANGMSVLAWMSHRDGAELAEVVGTLTVATPSGGRHLYYTAPDPGSGLAVRNSVGHTAGRITGLGWCIDVRALGGYVLGPGSRIRTASGGWGVYQVLDGTRVPWPMHPILRTRLAAIGNHTPGHDPGAVAAGGAPATASAPGSPGARDSHAPRSGRPGAGLPPVGGRSRFWTAAVAGELAHIAASVPGDQAGGGRNTTLNRAAYKLGRLIAPLQLTGPDIDQVAAQLLIAGLATGLGEREARTAIASGLAQGRANPRTLTPPASPPAVRPGARPTVPPAGTSPTPPPWRAAAGPRPGGSRPPGRAAPTGSRVPVRRPAPPVPPTGS